ncbi:MAG TPA: serine hydrolase domain-containing protein [Chryseosolibacter sp.]
MKPFLSLVIVLISLTVVAQAPKPVKTITPAAKPEEVGFSSERLGRIDAMLNDYVKNQQIPGAVVYLVRDGKVAYHKAFGYSDVDKKTALKKDDIFRIASQSKAITSLAVMMLWEEGKFLLDEPVSKYIPEFKSPKVLKTFNAADSTYTTEPAKGEITIRQLLTHSSGIDYAAIGSTEFKSIYAKAKVPSGIGNDKDVLADKIRILGQLPIKHNPGERWTYGLNHDVLGYLIEVWSKMSFDQFLRTRIFEPLGMNDTYFYLPKDKHARLVALHHDKEGKVVVMKNTAYDGVNPNYPNLAGTYFSGGAGLSSTVEDYAKFLQMFLNKGEYNGVRLLSRKTVELIMTDQLPALDNEYGLAFGLETLKNDHQSVFSAGTFSWGGAFNTHYWADPKERLIGLIYTNIFATQHWQIGERFRTLTYSAIAD